MSAAKTISPQALYQLQQSQRQRYADLHPYSLALSEQTQAQWLFGVPLHWMNDWSTPFPLFMQSAQGVDLVDVDGHAYVDFCLGASADRSQQVVGVQWLLSRHGRRCVCGFD